MWIAERVWVGRKWSVLRENALTGRAGNTSDTATPLGEAPLRGHGVINEIDKYICVYTEDSRISCKVAKFEQARCKTLLNTVLEVSMIMLLRELWGTSVFCLPVLCIHFWHVGNK